MTWRTVSGLLVLAALVRGQNDVTFRAVGGNVLEDGTLTAEVQIDNSSPQVYGWSYGICFDQDLLSVVETADGADTAVVKNGNSPDWALSEICSNGVSRGIIIDMMLGTALPVRQGFRDFELTLRARTLSPAEPDVVTTEIRPCHEAVCEPPTRAVWTDAGGTSFLAALAPDTVSVYRKVVYIRYVAPQNARIPIDPVTGDSLGTRTVRIALEEVFPSGVGTSTPALIQGFSLGMSYDPTQIVLEGLSPGTGLAGFNGGTGPSFFEAAVESTCFHATATISLAAPFEFLTAASPVQVLAVDLSVPSGVYGAITDAVPVTIAFVDTCGTPPVQNVVLVGGEELAVRDVSENSLELLVDPNVRNPFIRGDANADGRTDVGDAVWMIQELFLDGVTGTCTFSKDANADRRFDLSDVVYLIGYLFQHRFSPPSPPFPECGVVPDQLEEDCLSFPPCAG